MGKAKPALFLMLLLMVLAFVSQSFRVQAQTGTGQFVVRIDPKQTQPVEVGGTFTVQVAVDNAFDVEAAQAYFDYDPTIIEEVQMVEGPFLTSVGSTAVGQLRAAVNLDAQPPTGRILYSSALTTGATATGSGVLLEVTFTVLSQGGSPLQLVPYKAGSGGSGTYFLDINLVEHLPSALVDGYYGSPISLKAAPDVITSGQTATLAGTLSGPAALNVSSLSLEYNREGGPWAALAEVATTGSGSFSYRWTGNEATDLAIFEFRASYTLEGLTYYSPLAVVTVATPPTPLIGYIYDALIVLVIAIAAVAVVLFVRKKRRPEELPTLT